MAKTKVLIALDETRLATNVQQQLEEKGYECKVVEGGREAAHWIKKWHPDFALIDMFMRERNALECLQDLKAEGQMGPNRPKIFVVSGHSAMANVVECLRLGAADYIVKPFAFNDLLKRISFHSRRFRILGEVSINSDTQESANLFLYLIDMILKQAINPTTEHGFLLKLTQMVSVSIHAKRCSFIECSLMNPKGIVKASNDNPLLDSHEIDLDKYPEVRHTLNIQKVVVLDNLEQDPTMAKIKVHFKEIDFNAMVVVPVYVRGQLYGVLSARMPYGRDRLSDPEIRLVQIVAHVAGLGLSQLQSSNNKGIKAA